jgi:hypothetical protein
VQPEGDSFTLLGVSFDPKLIMADSIHDCAVQASWKLRTLLKTRRYYNDSELIGLFKAHILAFLEYRTPAFYHASTTALLPLDRILAQFLKRIGITEIESLMNFNLAPLAVRRDIAMLGLIHRTLLKKARAISIAFSKSAPLRIR